MAGYQEISVTHPVARKDHRCIWCSEKILKGQTYTRDVCIFEADFQSNKYHEECYTALAEYTSLDDDGSFEPGAHKRGSTDEKVTA